MATSMATSDGDLAFSYNLLNLHGDLNGDLWRPCFSIKYGKSQADGDLDGDLRWRLGFSYNLQYLHATSMATLVFLYSHPWPAESE